MAAHESSIAAYWAPHLFHRGSCFIVSDTTFSSSLCQEIRISLRNYFIHHFLFLRSCYISCLKFKVFRIIRHHQQQVHSNESSQNCGQPAIDLAKYKKSVFSILYILGVFYICYLPSLVVFAGLIVVINVTLLEAALRVSTLFLMLASSINPMIYIWRMSPIRTGVKLFIRKILCMESN